MRDVRSELRVEAAKLRETQNDLTETRGQLATSKKAAASASQRADIQAGQLKTLRACIGGIEKASRLAAFGDIGGANAAAAAVQVDCAKAVEQLRTA